ncbi:MAG TPA: DUF6152 family protein [Gammaproteobacteria bacterium]
MNTHTAKRGARLAPRVLGVLLLAAAAAEAHHDSQAEFGPFGSPTIYVEGRIVRINWANPHISIDMETTGGELPAGQKWRIVSHPIRIMEEYGFKREDFEVGDTLKLLAWTHVRGQPLIWPRAIQVNDGPLRSNLRFTDMIDIANGVFESLHIQPAANLNGSPAGRAGPETVSKLEAMGLLDEQGRMIWPPPDTAAN